MYTSHDFTTHRVTGGTRRFLELLYGFLDKGDEVHVFVPEAARLKEHPNLIRHNVDISKLGYIPKGIANFFLNRKRLKTFSRNISYDAFIAVDVPYVLQLSLLKIPKLVFIVWQDFVCYRLLERTKKNRFIDFIITKFLTYAERIAIKGANCINVQCQYDLKILCDRHSSLKKSIIEKTFIVPNNINTSWMCSEGFTKDDRNDNEKFTICFIGNIDDKRKGLHILLEAVGNLYNEGIIIDLQVIGGGHQLEPLRQQYKYLKNVIFWGYNSDPYKILNRCHLLVVPSLADSFPNTVLEALYLETGVIGSRRGGIPEILLYEDLLFEPNAYSLKEKLTYMLCEKNYENVLQLSLKRKEALTFDWVDEMRSNILNRTNQIMPQSI